MDCEGECIAYASENQENIPPEPKLSSDMKVDTERCALSESNQNSTPRASSRPEISLTATADSDMVSTSVNSQIKIPDVSCHLIYDDDGTSAATSNDKLKVKVCQLLSNNIPIYFIEVKFTILWLVT